MQKRHLIKYYIQDKTKDNLKNDIVTINCLRKMVLFQFHHYLFPKHPRRRICLYRYLQLRVLKDNLHFRALKAIAVLQTI